MLKLKFQNFGQLMQKTKSQEKTLMLGKFESRKRREWQGWDGWMVSLTLWTWVWASSRNWRWTGKSGMLRSTWKYVSVQFISVQLLSHIWLSVTPWTAAHQASLSFTNSQHLLKCVSIESMMTPNHLIRCHPLLLLRSIFFKIRVFTNESALFIRRPKCWSFSFSISPSNEYSGLISFRIDWFDLFAVQGILKSLLQHHSSKASVLQHSAFWVLPNLTSIHGYWKNDTFDYTDLCRQSLVCFLICCLGLS